MINVDPATMTGLDAATVFIHGVIAVLFVFFPIFLVVMREFSKFKNEEYLVSGHSSFSFIIILLIVIPIVAVFYIILNGVLEIMIPNIKPISNLTHAFWSIDPAAAGGSGVGGQSTEKEWVKGALYSIKHTRKIIEILSVTVVLIIMFYSIRISTQLLMNYESEKTAHTSIMGLAFKSILSMIVAWFALEFYNMGTKRILNHPDGGVWDLSIEWLRSGFENFYRSAS